jgi:hypothetical protein
MTDRLSTLYPELKWDEPVSVVVVGVGTRWSCRRCIATHGLKGSEIDATPYVFATHEEAQEHIDGHVRSGS